MQLLATICALYSIYARTGYSLFELLCSHLGSGQLLQSQCIPRKWKILSTRKIRQSLLVFYPVSSRRTRSFPSQHSPFFRLSLFSHPSLLFFFSFFRFSSWNLIVSSSSPPARSLKLGAGRRKALVELPLFAILPLYCLSRYLAIKSSSILYSRNQGASNALEVKFTLRRIRLLKFTYSDCTHGWFLICEHVLVGTSGIESPESK